VKTSATRACDAAAAIESPAPERDGAVLRIELRQCGGNWRVAVEEGGARRREIALSELIRWLADLSAGPGRSAHGLR
jgi:hypothetical protein